jgi:hypothetical protein
VGSNLASLLPVALHIQDYITISTVLPGSVVATVVGQLIYTPLQPDLSLLQPPSCLLPQALSGVSLDKTPLSLRCLIQMPEFVFLARLLSLLLAKSPTHS